MKKTLVLSTVLALLAAPAFADTPTFTINIKDHKFDPARVEVPADQQVKLLVKNLDPTPEEFESHDFKREKIIKGNSEATILVGPLKAGEYKFFGEFNEASAQGVLVAK